MPTALQLCAWAGTAVVCCCCCCAPLAAVLASLTTETKNPNPKEQRADPGQAWLSLQTPGHPCEMAASPGVGHGRAAQLRMVRPMLVAATVGHACATGAQRRSPLQPHCRDSIIAAGATCAAATRTLGTACAWLALLTTCVGAAVNILLLCWLLGTVQTGHKQRGWVCGLAACWPSRKRGEYEDVKCWVWRSWIYIGSFWPAKTSSDRSSIR